MSQEDQSSELSVSEETISILVSDVENYSRLDDFQLQQFFENVYPDMAEIFESHNVREMNSWGDGFIGFFNSPEDAARCSFNLRHFFVNERWDDIGLPPLNIRIALHTANVFFGWDPLQENEGAIGSNINLAARIEPKVIPGHIFVTELFKTNLEHHTSDFEFDPLYEVELAKGWGEETLYNIRKPHEQEITPEKVVEHARSFPDESTSKEKALISFLNSSDIEKKKRAVKIMTADGDAEYIEHLSEELLEQNTRADVRAVIARSLGKFNDARAVQPLHTAINDDADKKVINQSLQSLAELGNSSSIDKITAVLEDEEYTDDVRKVAVYSLHEFNDNDVIPHLMNVLENPDQYSSHVRQAAVHSLANIDDGGTVEPLIESLKDPAENVRGRAIEALGNKGPKRAIQPIAEVLDNTENTEVGLRRASATALKNIGDPDVIQPLTDALDDPDKKVRGRALSALGDLSATSAQDKVEAILLDETEDVEIRASAAMALGEIGQPNATEALIDVLDTNSLIIHRAIVRSLETIGTKEAIDTLVKILGNQDKYLSEVRDDAALALGEIGYPETLDALIDALDDPSVEVQRSATQSIASTSEPRAIDSLVNVLNSPGEYPGIVRRHAVAQFHKFEYVPQSVNESLVKTLQEDPDLEVKKIVSLMLGVLKYDQITDRLVSEVTDSSNDREYRGICLIALGLIANPEAESVIINHATSEEDWEIRRRSIDALGCIDTNSARAELREMAEAGPNERIQIRAQERLRDSPQETRDKLKEGLLPNSE